MAPGQLRIVPEAAGMGGLPTDLQPAVEADAAAGRRAGEDVEAGIGQALAHPCCCCCWLWWWWCFFFFLTMNPCCCWLW